MSGQPGRGGRLTIRAYARETQSELDGHFLRGDAVTSFNRDARLCVLAEEVLQALPSVGASPKPPGVFSKNREDETATLANKNPPSE